jgi:capsule polysaccharide export protein KpsE/RkpR
VPSPLSRLSGQEPNQLEARDGTLPRQPFGFQPILVTEATTSQVRGLMDWLWRGFSFWTVVPLIGIVGFVYLYLFADDLYDCQSIISLQNSSSMASSLGTLGSVFGAGATSSTTQSGALLAFITSHQMLMTLDKKFHLRQVYSAPGRNPFWRLANDASDEDFLTFYQGMVTVSQDSSTGLITITVLDYDAKRSEEMQKTIIAESSKFINTMSDGMRAATIKYAQDQFAAAMKAVETAQPYQQAVAEAELSAAQQGLASASGIANQQQVFLVPVANPVTPTDTAYPDRLQDEAAILLGASVFYMIGYLFLSNIRDHRRV